jgi:hypothetical protein
MKRKKPLVSPETALRISGLIQKLLVCNHGLSRWELDFLGCIKYNTRFSVKQAALIERFYNTVSRIGFWEGIDHEDQTPIETDETPCLFGSGG